MRKWVLSDSTLIRDIRAKQYAPKANLFSTIKNRVFGKIKAK